VWLWPCLVPCVGAKLQDGSDGLVSSSKLQPYLELCWFNQALLKTKVARWKVHFLVGISKRPMYIHSSESMEYYSRYATGKKNDVLGVSLLQQVRSWPQGSRFPIPWWLKAFLVCFESYLTFLSIVYISSTPNQVYCLARIHHRVILHRFLCSPSLHKS
jgi:hypothetical protein